MCFVLVGVLEHTRALMYVHLGTHVACVRARSAASHDARASRRVGAAPTQHAHAHCRTCHANPRATPHHTAGARTDARSTSYTPSPRSPRPVTYEKTDAARSGA